ncbi:SNF-related serine/threonine-protein kinase (SNF1-related kinase) [Durusdinium trenchii]|uniref:SNF-related serine/threonine-protein kinase (SNF1-related kinase) n=1 Tax=Durusdinium trenchii TaxID=1381693 RepID=A0ABP0HZM2_9DINO
MSDAVSTVSLPSPAASVAESAETDTTVLQESFEESYVELEELGRGEFGLVRRAFHRKTGKQVAVKHLPKTAKSAEEVAILSQLTGHENIARLLNYFETEQELLVVLELCDEGPLSDYLIKHLKGRPLSDEERAALLQQLLLAVQHCHKSGFVHNDLKFDNIMLASGASLPKLKLIDFGNASRADAKRKPADDIWFLGLIFYQLITGQPFFQMDNDELDSLEEQGVYVDPGRMQCDAYYVQLRLSIAKRFANSITLDLMSKMLQTKQSARISAADALEHPFLLRLKERLEEDTPEMRKGSLESLGHEQKLSMRSRMYSTSDQFPPGGGKQFSHHVPLLIFQIGTNNWQRQGEFAPGSGILHASFHQTMNSMDGVKCFSIYPSKVQTDPQELRDDDTFRIFKIKHDIPICESVSPNSSYRWHSMDDREYQGYLDRLESEICAFMDAVEAKEGKEFDYLISHHAFTNAMTAAQIVERRHKEGKTKLKHFNFVHGTALKMYIKEKEGDPEYPMRFLTKAQGSGVFNGIGHTQGVWVNSEDYIGKFLDCFPSYPKGNCVFSRIGVNQKIFCPRGTQVAQDLSKHLREEDRWKVGSMKRLVTFVGKFADWKRLDAVLYAAKEYEATFPDLGTAIVGTGPPEAIEMYEGLSKSLGLQRTVFLGPKSQDVLAELFSMSEEPFGMVFIECMACGTPTIGANSGGPTEFVKPEQGVLVDEEPDWRTEVGMKRLGSKVAAQVTKALQMDWKKRMGRGCVDFVTTNFSTLAQVRGMLANMEEWSSGADVAQCFRSCSSSGQISKRQLMLVLQKILPGRHSAALEQMVESSGASRGEAREGTWTRNRP